MPYGTTARLHAVPAAAPPLWLDRIGDALVAAAVGGLVSFFLTLVLERAGAPWLAAGLGGLIYLAALYLGGEAVVTAFTRRVWAFEAFAATHVAAMLLWPYALFVAASGSPLLLAGPPAAAMTAFALACAPTEDEPVFRVHAHACLVAALAANQATMFFATS